MLGLTLSCFGWLRRCQDFAAPCLRKCLCKCCAINFVSISLEQCFPAPGERLQPFPLVQQYHDASLHSLTRSLASISNEITSLEIHHYVLLLMKNGSISYILTGALRFSVLGKQSGKSTWFGCFRWTWRGKKKGVEHKREDEDLEGLISTFQRRYTCLLTDTRDEEDQGTRPRL